MCVHGNESPAERNCDEKDLYGQSQIRMRMGLLIRVHPFNRGEIRPGWSAGLFALRDFPRCPHRRRNWKLGILQHLREHRPADHRCEANRVRQGAQITDVTARS